MDPRRSMSSQLEKSDEKLDEAGPDRSQRSLAPAVSNASSTWPQDADIDLERNGSSPHPDASSQKDPNFLVKWEEGEKANPMNFSPIMKMWITWQLGFLALVGSLGSSIVSPAEDELAKYFHVGTETMVLAVSLNVLGFAVGPMMWGPISEVYGRKWSMIPAVTIMSLFAIGSAVSVNPQSFFITRFFAGLFGSAPISNVSAALGDIYEAQARGIAMAFYAICVVGGPTLGPVIGSALTTNPHLGWRWTEYIEAIFGGLMAAIALVSMPELYSPVLLKKKAQRLRKETGDDRYWHPHEENKITPTNIVTKYFSRPLVMLVTEPAVTALALYASFVYGMLYLFLEVFPIVFYQWRGYGLVVSTLPFIGIFIGTLCAMVINVANQPMYMKAVKKNGGRAVPEARLPPMFLGGIFFVVGLFWFGWTAGPSIPWIVPTIAAGFIGAGFNIIFQQCLNFLVDTYGPYAASAVAANTFLRSMFACGLPLAAGPMFRNMGVGPAASLLGGISCIALPLPFIFHKYGVALRKRSKFAPYQGD